MAVIGMGGYAQSHHRSVRTLEEEGLAQLVCCSSRRGAEAPEAETFKFVERGTKIYSDWELMLSECADLIDVVAIPTPVADHAPMHRACVDLGLPAFLEKPPSLDYAEYRGMVETEAGRRGPETFVGFNFIVEPARQRLKARLQASALTLGLSPEDTDSQ